MLQAPADAGNLYMQNEGRCVLCGRGVCALAKPLETLNSGEWVCAPLIPPYLCLALLSERDIGVTTTKRVATPLCSSRPTLSGATMVCEGGHQRLSPASAAAHCRARDLKYRRLHTLRSHFLPTDVPQPSGATRPSHTRALAGLG
jgi:hypothetical protein